MLQIKIRARADLQPSAQRLFQVIMSRNLRNRSSCLVFQMFLPVQPYRTKGNLKWAPVASAFRSCGQLPGMFRVTTWGPQVNQALLSRPETRTWSLEAFSLMYPAKFRAKAFKGLDFQNGGSGEMAILGLESRLSFRKSFC